MGGTKIRRRRPSEDIGKAIHDLRLDAGLRQEDIAQKLGVTQGQVSMWERAVNTPSLGDLKKIEKACKAPQGAVLRLAELTPEFSISDALLTDPDLLPHYRRLAAEQYSLWVKLSEGERSARQP